MQPDVMIWDGEHSDLPHTLAPLLMVFILQAQSNVLAWILLQGTVLEGNK